MKSCFLTIWIISSIVPDVHKILILDNHESHISLTVIDKAKASGIVMRTIPPNTFHSLQALDVSVFGPFKASYNRAMDNWLRSNPRKTVTIYGIPAFVKAQLSAMLPRNILSGFESTGTWPYNRDFFSEEDFAPAIATDRLFTPDNSSLFLLAQQPLWNQVVLVILRIMKKHKEQRGQLR